jgi:hypothetical protein
MGAVALHRAEWNLALKIVFDEPTDSVVGIW